MRHLLRLVALSIIAVGGSSAVAQEQNISPELAREIAREACIWGYPLVLIDVTRQVPTNHEVASNELGLAPMNQFAHARAFPSASFHTVVRLNFDTLYSNAWLDVLRNNSRGIDLPSVQAANGSRRYSWCNPARIGAAMTRWPSGI